MNKVILGLNYTLDQMDLTDILRTFHPTAECTFLSTKSLRNKKSEQTDNK